MQKSKYETYVTAACGKYQGRKFPLWQFHKTQIYMLQDQRVLANNLSRREDEYHNNVITW